MNDSVAANLASSTVATLQSTLSGIIPAVYPTLISVAALFTFYHILKSLYHARF